MKLGASPDLRKNNMYLKGGSSIAEALLNEQNTSGEKVAQVSIAMRLKRNRDAALGIA